MTTHRRKFIELLALGVPAATTAMAQGASPAQKSVPATKGSLDRQLEVAAGASAFIAGIQTERDGYVRVVRRDSQPGIVRWAVEIAEPDTSSETIQGKHPRVLLVFGQNLQALYGISLEQAGCKVDCALDIDSAMRLYQTHGPYDVVLTDLVHRDLIGRIRKINPVQPLAIVAACSAANVRFNYRIPVLREGPRQRRLVRLVESAINPQVKVLLVAANPNCWPEKELKGPIMKFDRGLYEMIDMGFASFELELETDGNDALKNYRERGPYHLLLSELRLPGLSGPDLAAAIRSENPRNELS